MMYEYLLEHPCVDCGESDILVLKFDHLRDKKKDVTRLVHDSVSWATVMKEIDKCEVVCANCHIRRTSARAGNWLRASIANAN
jgi:hypothetical protein